ncbi:transmembrane protein, putative [Medicago truncatula]|uniref:Transmembrane protein, putative n=1 Tax=Medicago truncatula TaxID=3880 RepID=A0A072TFJ1_MEDTR|nr:transmembrane protein, putative [Medicago truncatula]
MSLRMSVTYLLFFLCIFFHAYCTQDMKLEKTPHFSIKTDNINDFESIPNHFLMMNEGRKMKTWLVNTQKSKKELCTNQKVFNAMRKDSSEINKLSEKNPELDLDYSVPWSHPPYHN